jgi:hypothetical protein
MRYECFECLPPYVASLAMKECGNFVNFQKAQQRDDGVCHVLEKWAYNIALTRSQDVSNGE